MEYSIIIMLLENSGHFSKGTKIASNAMTSVSGSIWFRSFFPLFCPSLSFPFTNTKMTYWEPPAGSSRFPRRIVDILRFFPLPFASVSRRLLPRSVQLLLRGLLFVFHGPTFICCAFLLVFPPCAEYTCPTKLFDKLLLKNKRFVSSRKPWVGKAFAC